jgi:hypothetical protein
MPEQSLVCVAGKSRDRCVLRFRGVSPYGLRLVSSLQDFFSGFRAFVQLSFLADRLNMRRRLDGPAKENLAQTNLSELTSPHGTLPSAATSTFQLRGRESTGRAIVNKKNYPSFSTIIIIISTTRKRIFPQFLHHPPRKKKESLISKHTPEKKSWATATAKDRLSHRCQTANRRSRLLRPPFQETSMTFPSES